MSEIMRSQQATTPAMAAAADIQRRSMSSGWWGMAIFIAGETTFFALVISSYFYLRFQVADWPPPGVEKPKVLLPLVLTAILVAASAPLVAAVRAGRRGRLTAAWLLVLVALLIQAGYLGVQIHEFLTDLDKVRPKESSYGSIYIAMLGLHHLHVAVGIAIEAWLVTRLWSGMTNYRMIALRVVALYWYFVNTVAVAVVFTQIYPSL
jgi:heme/copper-type cytochrome/quinol oxidase subunit 3